MKIYIYQRATSSSYQKFSRSKPYITFVNEPVEEGDIGGYQIPPPPQKKKRRRKKERGKEKGMANTEMLCRKSTKYRCRIKFGHTYLKSYPSRVFVYLKYVCIHRNHPLQSSARKREEASNWSTQRSKSPVPSSLPRRRF